MTKSPETGLLQHGCLLPIKGPDHPVTLCTTSIKEDFFDYMPFLESGNTKELSLFKYFPLLDCADVIY